METASEFLLEPIRHGAEFTLYRGRQQGNASPILVVAPTAQQPLRQSLRRLEHEYSLAAMLEPAWAARPLALMRHEGRTILVLADPGGEPLDRVLERNRGQPLEFVSLLHRAINMATALSHAHHRGLTHKDVRPENVLVDDAGHVWLTGFGIASLLPHERQSPAPPEIIAGTFAYMSPEQTGRMNRSVDIRSDLYSLGVTLYQMLTGGLPFAAADPLEWIHCHIARQPAAPADLAEVPRPLSAIVMKLLAKDAEDRYQTAAGLEADLRRCFLEWQSHGRIDPFPLGEGDSSDRLLIPEKLYGREREVDALLAAFERIVADGAVELVLVSGYSGVGKSSVVNELHKALVPPRGLFAAGKFDQYKRDVPYATLAQAFQMLVREILVKSEAEVDHWRRALVDALGPNGQLMVNLIPELESLIGKQPPVADLPAQAARNRFQLVFRRLLDVFATPEHPLALFLDDLQWLDIATLELLERLITDRDVRHLLLIGAYRGNEVNPSHPLMRTLTAMRDAGARAQEIVLAPLSLDEVERLITDALRCGPNSAGPLALLVEEKTGGNPFFVIQLLTGLTEEGLLRFDRGAAAWIWDLDRIRGKGYSDNVADLMLEKLRRLPRPTQTALQQLASLGNLVGIELLTLGFGQSDEQVGVPLWDAVRTGLIIRRDGSYAFLHDRIQEAAYSLIPENERAEAHLRIGRELLANLTTDGLLEHVFDVANQLNRGAELLADHSEKVQVAAIDLKAGRKAKASAAYASARAYFAAGAALLDEGDWSGEYELTFRLWLERSECEFLTGHFEEAEELIAELLRRAASRVDRAAVYCLKILLHMMKSENQQAVAAGLASLRQLGIDIPAHPTEDQVEAEYDAVWHALDGRPIESLIDLPLMTDQALQAATQVLAVLSSPAHFTDFRLYCLLPCRMVQITVLHGTSAISAQGYAFFGVMLCWYFHRYSEGYRFARLGCDLVEKHGFTESRAKVLVFSGAAAAWTQPISTAIDFIAAGIRTASETGDLTYACLGVFISVTYLLVRNDPLDALRREADIAMEVARKVKYGEAADTIASQQRFVAAMQGRALSFTKFSGARFDEAEFEAQLTSEQKPSICAYWLLKLKARFLLGDYAQALAAADKAKPLLAAAVAQGQLIDYFFYAALTVAALYDAASEGERSTWRELLETHREQLREWAETYPPTFADKHTLVLAEIARIDRQGADALCLYEEAVRSARDNGFVQNEGLAHELAAQYCLARNLETPGYAYLRNARNCYDMWGAHGKVKQLDERYPRLREGRTMAASAAVGPPVGQLDVETVVKASQAISSEIVLPELIEKLVRIAVANAGAERGLLIMPRSGYLRIEAEAVTRADGVEVAVRPTTVAPSDLPLSALNYAIRRQESVLLDDASGDSVYAKDEYVRQKRSRSVLCLPIVKQAKLVGALYLENNLTPGAFTPDRVTLLQLLASQAAISLENATLFSDLQRSETYLAKGQSVGHTGTFGRNVLSGDTYWSEEFYRIFEYDLSVKPELERVLERIHPEDRIRVQQTIQHATHHRTGLDMEFRLLSRDHSVKHLCLAVQALEHASGVLELVGAVTDVTAAKKAEEKIRKGESELRQILDIAPQHVYVLEADPGATRLYANQAALDYFGLTFEEWLTYDLRELFHPDDWERASDGTLTQVREGLPHEVEIRLRRKDGKYRWFLSRRNPLRDELGRLTRWYTAATDIEDRKAAQQRLQDENVALREEIDKASMFEEIVGVSAPLKKVLSRISRVAPTDSGVLITGGTGTGKELVARAIHRRSRRSAHAFVSVNCAAVPRDLIASELFGHEKGAFTGATQRRFGRFELAEKGTIFLDEVGELPAETQIALLRVLQEREFERVGGTGALQTDVRVVAATNRDLEAAITAGIFRSDLYYRLNVFPIEMPTLRERREDIPLLVEYFLARYARKAGKSFRTVNRQSLDLLQSYPWPGNIRELQNVIERSVIVSDGDVFSVDESWLSRQPRTHDPRNLQELPRQLATQEKEMIEAALRECRGRVAGSTGAAAQLGMPGSTLESKIKSLKIDKNRFRAST